MLLILVRALYCIVCYWFLMAQVRKNLPKTPRSTAVLVTARWCAVCVAGNIGTGKPFQTISSPSTLIVMLVLLHFWKQVEAMLWQSLLQQNCPILQVV